jgi:uncharacterized membrane protein
MDGLRTISLILATLAMGHAFGVFALYSHTIMRGLRTTDDRTFVGAFQAIDRAIINPWFLAGGFVGALVLTFVTGLLHVGRDEFWWILAAFVLYAVVVVLTARINVPRNDAIKAAGDPDGIPDLAAVRAAFDERRWTGVNHVRTVVNLAAFVLLLVAIDVR